MKLTSEQVQAIADVFLGANTDQYFDRAKESTFYAEIVREIVESNETAV